MTRFVLLILFFSLPVTTSAAVSSGDFPEGAVWYLHADLKAMRSTESGSELYDWLDDEVLDEIKDEVGFDLKKEIDQVTAFSSGDRGAVIVIDGAISQNSKDKLLAVAELEGGLDLRTHDKKTYYLAGDERVAADDDNDIDSLDESAYFSFALKNKLIVTSDEDQLKTLLDSDGKIAGAGNKNGALFILTAEKEFVQAGMRTGEFAGEGMDWDSSILKNIEEAAVLVSDSDGLIAVEAKLISSDPRMAESVASIVNGLISLQAFSTDMEPELAQILENTKVKVDDNVLSITTVVDPKIVIDAVNH